MSIYEAIGLAWIILTSLIGNIGFIYFCWKGVRQTAALLLRGEFEENLGIQKQIETKFMERMAR